MAPFRRSKTRLIHPVGQLLPVGNGSSGDPSHMSPEAPPLRGAVDLDFGLAGAVNAFLVGAATFFLGAATFFLGAATAVFLAYILVERGFSSSAFLARGTATGAGGLGSNAARTGRLLMDLAAAVDNVNEKEKKKILAIESSHVHFV